MRLQILTWPNVKIGAPRGWFEYKVRDVISVDRIHCQLIKKDKDDDGLFGKPVSN